MLTIINLPGTPVAGLITLGSLCFAALPPTMTLPLAALRYQNRLICNPNRKTKQKNTQSWTPSCPIHFINTQPNPHN
jgi:hypothetical protein